MACIRIAYVTLFLAGSFLLCLSQETGVKWRINDLEYLEAPGMNVLAFHNSYPVGMQGGVELIHHGERIATNGFIIVDLPSDHSFPRPESSERKVVKENMEIQARVSVPTLDFNYTVRIWPEKGSVHLAVDLDAPLRDEWAGRATFDLLLYPVSFNGKTYQLGDQFGVFPVEALGPRVEKPDGEIETVPMARGSRLTIAAEDPERKLQFEAVNGELLLIDGRNTMLRGWFIIRSIVPSGKDKGALEWVITPNLIPGWNRDPVICLSQVGYHPAQVKQAIIEQDQGMDSFQEIELIKIGQEEATAIKLSTIPVNWGRFLRYQYGIFDFTSVEEPGIYQIRYGNEISSPFKISPDVYAEGVWQPTLEIYFPVQMCHMRVRDRVRVWHGACHLDDALQAPVSIEHVDGYRSYANTETEYKPLTTVPFLNRGGWHDAGDNDLAAGSQAQTTLFLALAGEAFEIVTDQTTVKQDALFAELRVPDGVPDLLQQIEHGVVNLLSGYRASGHSFAGIIATREGRSFLGDVASLTDQFFYDKSLKSNEIRGNKSGKNDDRWVFTNRDTGLEYQVITALAAASRFLRGYNNKLAEECLTTAIRSWEYEQTHKPLLQPNAYVPWNYKQYETLATAELLITTEEDRYRERYIALLPDILENIDHTGWSFARALTLIDDNDFKNPVMKAIGSYAENLERRLQENPFGIPWEPRIWGVGWSIQRYALEQYYLHRAFPEWFDRENILRVVNYVLGCHPGSSTSLVSGVGAHSLTVAYGFNMHWWSYIPGGMASGTALIRPDYPELKEPFPYLWQQSEYVMGGAASYIFCVLAAEQLLNGN